MCDDGAAREADRISACAPNVPAKRREIGRKLGREAVVQLRWTAPGKRERIGHQARERTRARNRVRGAELVAVVEHVDVAVLVGCCPLELMAATAVETEVRDATAQMLDAMNDGDSDRLRSYLSASPRPSISAPTQTSGGAVSKSLPPSAVAVRRASRWSSTT